MADRRPIPERGKAPVPEEGQLVASSPPPDNPLGLNIDFLFGRGFLWARSVRLSDWITLDALRMEIPDLQFPFDARGGLHRFRSTRCLVREIELSVSEAGLQEMIGRAANQIEGFEDLRVRIVEGAAHVSLRISVLGASTWMSFRMALIPPEPARADEIHLSLYDYRAYGPLPYPSRLLAYELIVSLLETPTLRPPGRGESFTVGIAGDIISLRPIKLLLLHLFPRVGWKLPNLAGVRLEGARLRPGQLSLRATAQDEGAWSRAAIIPMGGAGTPDESFGVLGTLEGQRALAAYEAKDLFAPIDRVLFEGDLTGALEQLALHRQTYGPHPELIARTLECLLADPSPAHVAEAEAICQELLSEDHDDLMALCARPTLAALAGRGPDAIVERLDALACVLRRRHDLDDWVLCELTAASMWAERAPERAVARLKGILRVAPRHVEALERIVALTQHTGDWSEYEEALKRLTGVYTDREALRRTYMALARHLMDRRGEVGEARLYLERVLRLDPGALEALDALGEGYVLGGEPLRALKAFGSASRAAESAGRLARAASLQHRGALLWRDDLENSGEALLGAKRALSLQERAWESKDDEAHPLDIITYLELCAELSAQRERWDEALRYRTELVRALDALMDARDLPPSADAISQSSAQSGLRALGIGASEQEEQDAARASLTRRLVNTQRALATLYTERDRPQAAAARWREVLTHEPGDEQAADHLERLYRASGQPDQLIAFYRELIEGATHPARQIALHVKLAALYEALQMAEAASDELRAALAIDPNHERAREQLVALLRGAGRPQTLRDALDQLLVTARERRARHAILMESARLDLGALGRPRQAARRFFEALDLEPADAEALDGAREALAQIAEKEGARAPAPVGKEDVSRLRERVLQRLVDLREDALDRAHLLDEIAALAEARGASGAAHEATQRAISERERTGGGERASVDDRLSSLLAPDPLERAPMPTIRKPEARSAEGDESTMGLEESTASASDSQEQAKLRDFRARMTEALRAPAPPLQSGLIPPAGAAKRAPSVGEWESLERARRGEDHEAIVSAIETILSGDTSQLDRERLAQLAREAGELSYYEMEDNGRARTLLERAVEWSPDGEGARPSVLNALESIYEEGGEARARIELLERRMSEADSQDMEDTYRLIIAQLWWDEFHDEARAVGLLDAITDRDRTHEAANKLLAQIARDQQQWDRAARHLELVLSQRSGGLDEVELERELADLYLHKLSDPERAMRHYEGVLEASAADAQALEGVKQCQAMRNDWTGYVSSLSREFGLLSGKQGVDLGGGDLPSPEALHASLRMAASQIISDAAHVVQMQLGSTERAHALWGLAHRMWPEHVEALERRIEIDRDIHDPATLAADLEAWADLVVDTSDRFGAMVEAARSWDESGDRPRARQTLAEALAMIDQASDGPEEAGEARRLLRSWQEPD